LDFLIYIIEDVSLKIVYNISMNYSKEALRKEKEKKEAEIADLLGMVANAAYGGLRGCNPI
jgi:hypothetical protein